MAHTACAEAFYQRKAAFQAWCIEPRPQWTAADLASTPEARAQLREALTYCACGGKAEDHREDKDGNLLECSHCDNCDHFNYQTHAEAA